MSGKSVGILGGEGGGSAVSLSWVYRARYRYLMTKNAAPAEARKIERRIGNVSEMVNE
jgi:hypothetical protein